MGDTILNPYLIHFLDFPLSGKTDNTIQFLRLSILNLGLTVFHRQSTRFNLGDAILDPSVLHCLVAISSLYKIHNNSRDLPVRSNDRNDNILHAKQKYCLG